MSVKPTTVDLSPDDVVASLKATVASIEVQLERTKKQLLEAKPEAAGPIRERLNLLEEQHVAAKDALAERLEG